MATYGHTFTSGDTVTPTKLNNARTVSEIVNADISATAGILDTKLATISTAGKVSNSATTATNANTASAIVARDASGNFSAGTITAALSGNVTGNVTGTASAIADGTVTTAKIVDDNVTNAKIASGVDASKLTTGTLPADRIGSDAITTARINNAAVTAAKLDGAQTGSAPIYGCRAWVNFDGTRDSTGASTTAATNRFIRASGNVTSVLRNGDGDYTITFTTAMPDTNYCVLGTTCTPTTVARGGATVGIREFDDGSGSAITTSTLRISVRSGSTAVDAGLDTNRRNICVSIFR